MKSLKESIFDNIDDIVSNDPLIHKTIEQFLRDNYEIDGTYEIRGTYNIDGNVVDVDGHAAVKNKYIKSLTNGVFRFRNVTGKFSCAYCKKLASLEGAPKEVSGRFYCNGCESLTSLKGAPEKVGGEFDCSNCSILKISDQDRKKYKIVT